MRGNSASGIVLAAGCAALAFAMGTASAQPRRPLQRPDPITQSASCKVPHLEVATTDEEFDGTATEWTALPNATVNFHTKRSGCVVVTISALGTEETDNALVQMVVDGAMVCGPANGMEYPSTLFSPGTTVQTESMTYLCKDVPPGDHSLQAQYVTLGGGLVQFFNHTLTVAHN